MVAFQAVLSTLVDTEILQIYQELIEAADSGNDSLVSTIRAKKLEPAIRKYISSQTGIKYRAGVGSEPDFTVTDWDEKSQGPAPNVELKAKTSERIGIKIGGAAVKFDTLFRGGLLESSQIDALRNSSSMQTVRVSRPPLERNADIRRLFVERNQDKYYLAAGGRYIGKIGKENKKSPLSGSKEMKLINEFKDILETEGILDSILFEEKTVKIESETAQNIVRDLRNIQPHQKLFDFLAKEQPESYNELKTKSKNVLVTFPTLSKERKITALKTAYISFQGNYFNSNNFYIKIKQESASSLTFYPYIKDPIEKAIVNQFNDANFKAADFVVRNQLENLKKITETLTYKRKFTKEEVQIPGEIYAAMLGYGKPGSIPQPAVRAIVRRKSSAFTSRTAAARQTLAQTKRPSMGDFISSDTITALTKREMMRRMPIGPVGGRPLSSRVLTYRTGRFVQSLKVIADTRNQAIQYYYSPLYWVHETTSRNPHSLIGSSIASVTRSLFNRRFSISKSETEI